LAWRRWWYFAIAIISAILFTAFLIYDLQLLMGGGARELSPDEYIFAAVNIYLVRRLTHPLAWGRDRVISGSLRVDHFI
jgi:hypothetical protein